MCMTVFLSYLPEAGQYSCMFLYLKQVSALNHLLYIIFFNSVLLKKAKINLRSGDFFFFFNFGGGKKKKSPDRRLGQNTTCVLVWIDPVGSFRILHRISTIHGDNQLKFTKHQSALSPPIRLQDNVNNKELLSFLWNSSVKCTCTFGVC